MTRTRTSRAGADAEAGFTLVELLAVMLIVVVAAGAIALWLRPSAGAAGLKSAALRTAAHLRDARMAAIETRSEQVVLINAARRVMAGGAAGAPLAIAGDIAMAVTAADAERRGRDVAGIRFFPNGGSTGGTVRLEQRQRAYEVRVNWLTGRVSVHAGL